MEDRATILLVDDDVTLLQATSALLELSGFHTVISDTAPRAIEFLEHLQITAVVIDMFMPDQDGVETIRVIRERWPDLPIVAMSGGWRTIKAEQALELADALGAGAVLSKPFDRETLLAALDQAMGR